MKMKRERIATLNPEEDHAWEFAFAFYCNEGCSDSKADKLVWRDMLADGAVAVDKFLVAVAEEGAEVRKAVLEMEENRAAAEERLEVAVDLLGEELVELAQQARLASNPLEKRSGFQSVAVIRLEKRHRQLRSRANPVGRLLFGDLDGSRNALPL